MIIVVMFLLLSYYSESATSEHCGIMHKFTYDAVLVKIWFKYSELCNNALLFQVPILEM